MSHIRRYLSIALFSVAALAATGRALVEPLPNSSERIRVGGSGALRIVDGQQRAQFEHNNGFMVYQAGIVITADIRENLSFWYDMNLIREGIERVDPSRFTRDHLEQLFVRWDNILGPKVNLKVGRVFAPFGEEYLRWNEIDNPFASYSAGFHWSLGEGAVLFGDVLPDGMLSYAAAIQNGNLSFNYDDNYQKAYSVKLMTEPKPWVHVSASYLNLGLQGKQGISNSSNTATEWWLSGFPIGPNPAGPSTGTISGQAGELNVKVSGAPGSALARYTYVSVNDGSGADFDRIIRAYTMELIGNVPGTERKAYVGGRWSSIGTYNPTRGSRFAGTELATTVNTNNSPYSSFGFGMRDLTRYSLVGGYKFDRTAVLKLEYSWENAHLVAATNTTANQALLSERNFFIAELAVRF